MRPSDTRLPPPGGESDARNCNYRLGLIIAPVRFGQAAEMAKAALYFASDESSFVTGTEFVVDGGITAAYVTPE